MKVAQRKDEEATILVISTACSQHGNFAHVIGSRVTLDDGSTEAFFFFGVATTQASLGEFLENHEQQSRACGTDPLNRSKDEEKKDAELRQLIMQFEQEKMLVSLLWIFSTALRMVEFIKEHMHDGGSDILH
jgi:hypothetical protein